ncbi:Protein of unknown function [Desulfovibrio legallii]|uniref:DUF721 domain-containing protein n=1 Tax=Desulfovibrio legallii TaxID=571438 RepID=A0A1G7L1C5_9BACT|nr:Protein of unknown function [Desulfovibrio legallii]
MARRKRKRTAASGPVPVGEALAGVFAGLGLDPAAAAQRARLQSLWEHWEAVMGPDLAPLARPLGHRRDLLLVGAEDAMLAQDLHYLSPELLERANAFMEAPVFQSVRVSLLLGKDGLDVAAAAPLPPSRTRPVGRSVPLPRPSGDRLAGMDPASPVARAYALFAGRRPRGRG